MNKITKNKIFYKTFFLSCLFAVLSCFPNKLSPFFKKKNNCEKKEKNLYNKPREFILRKADLCVKQGQAKRALFILEPLLKREKLVKKKTEETKTLIKQLADLSFYKLKNYSKALKYYNDLLKFSLKPSEKFSLQYHIAQSYFHLKKYSQALVEIKQAFSKEISIEERKRALILQGGLFMAQNQFDKASELFQKQKELFPDHKDFFREYLAFIYESQKKFSLAVQELEQIEQPSAFILDQIERLKERQNNQPGF